MHESYPDAPLRCVSDCKVIIDQLSGRCAVRAARLQPLHAQASALVRLFARIELVAIPRELNQLADALAWEALGGRRSLMRYGK
jgi:ribonuclease HI